MKNLLFATVGIVCAALTATAQPVMQHDPISAAPAAPASSDRQFQSEMAEAMRRMDEGMMVRPSGNADRDFAAMMIPHHQGAIDMAKAELKFGHDPVLRRLAQGIIVEQQQEIELMRRQLNKE